MMGLSLVWPFPPFQMNPTEALNHSIFLFPLLPSMACAAFSRNFRFSVKPIIFAQRAGQHFSAEPSCRMDHSEETRVLRYPHILNGCLS